MKAVIRKNRTFALGYSSPALEPSPDKTGRVGSVFAVTALSWEGEIGDLLGRQERGTRHGGVS